jgi:outer membrane lipoprotein
MTVLLFGCAKVPRQYVRMAEPDVTLTALIDHPERYRGKVVLLGGTIIEEETNEQHLWLRVKNRPLDQDYIPHRPADTDGPEAGSYWVMVAKQQLPPNYRHWARMTVVGRVTGTQRFETEPVLSLIYVRGWGMSTAHDGAWASVDPSYLPSAPSSIQGELGGGPP